VIFTAREKAGGWKSQGIDAVAEGIFVGGSYSAERYSHNLTGSPEKAIEIMAIIKSNQATCKEKLFSGLLKNFPRVPGRSATREV
jgi:hypothetical protein